MRLHLFPLSIRIFVLHALVVPGLLATTDSTLNNNVGKCHIEQFGAYNALAQISREAHVAVGVEAVVDFKSEPTMTLDFPGGTITDLLNMFVSQAPEYRWEEAHGIIHVFRNGTHLSIADVVMSYPGAQDKTREEIWEDIAKRPEIAAWMTAKRCSRQELFNGKEFRGNNGPVSIEAGSMTLAQLLDDVALKSGENYWAILQSTPDTACQVSILLW